jgi:hypothetical protein
MYCCFGLTDPNPHHASWGQVQLGPRTDRQQAAPLS